MQYTALDVLIIMKLSESGGKVVVPQKAFLVHSHVVRTSPYFKISPATSDQLFIEPQDVSWFQKQCQKRYRWYKQDRVGSFAGNGLNLLRIAENARFFSQHLLSHVHLEWNLTENTFQCNGQIQARNGTCWAWDWLFVLWFARKGELICPRKDFPLQLHFDCSKRGEWICSVQLSYNMFSFQDPALLYYGFAELKNRVIEAGPFKWVEKSNRVTLDGHLIRLNRLSPAAKKLLWATLTWNSDNPIPIKGLYPTLFGKNQPRKNKMRNGPSSASLSERQKKAIENLRDELMTEIKQIISKYKIPWKIAIHVYADGIDVLIEKH